MAKQKVTLTDNSIKSGVTSDANKAIWAQRIYLVGKAWLIKNKGSQPVHEEPDISNPSELCSESLDFGIEGLCRS